MFTFSLPRIRPIHCKKHYLMINSDTAGNFLCFFANARYYTSSVDFLLEGSCRRNTIVCRSVRSARNVHFGQSGTSRHFCSARHSGGPTTAQEQKQGRAARYQSDMRESGSGSGSRSRGGKGHESDPISKSLRRSPSDFNTHITSMCSSSSSDGGCSAVDAFVKGWLPGCTVREISDFMRITGKKSRNKTRLHLKRNLPAIASRIKKLPTVSWRYRDISAVVYGLQCLREDDDGYLAVVAAMTAALVKSNQSREAVPFKSISMAMIGLQKNKLRARQSVELLNSIMIMTKSCHESPDAQEVGNALHGMQSMSSDHAEVRSMVSALSGKVHSCKESLTAQNVGNALHGMQSMSSDHAEVRSMVSALSGKVHSCKESLDAMAVGNALYGMQSMSSDHAVGETDGIEIIPGSREYFVINIEVDGMHHRQGRKINFCKMRDAHLKSRGVVVHRIDASLVTKMNDNRLEQWLLDVTAESLLMSGGA